MFGKTLPNFLQGGVYCLRDSGAVQDCFKADKAVLEFLYWAEKNILLTLSQDLMMHQHSVGPDCNTSEIIRVKLNGKFPGFRIDWCGPGVLAMCSGTNQIRLWDLNTEENVVLALSSVKGFDTTDALQLLHYSSSKGILSAALSGGKVALWRRKEKKNAEEAELEEQFRLQAAGAPVGDGEEGDLVALEWRRPTNDDDDEQDGCLAVATESTLYFVKERLLVANFHPKSVAVQTGANGVSVTKLDKMLTIEVKHVDQTAMICGLHIAANALIVWDGASIVVSDLDQADGSTTIGSFSCATKAAATYAQNIYTAEADRLNVRTFQGTVKQLLTMAEIEGEPAILNVSGQFLALATSNGFLKVYDLSRREARQQHHAKYAAEGLRNFGRIESIATNVAGNKVSFCVRTSEGKLDAKLYVWDAEADALYYFDFQKGTTDQEELDGPSATLYSSTGRRQQLQNKLPGFHCWDSADPRLLVAEAVSLRLEGGTQVVTMFVTTENGLLCQDFFAKSRICAGLIGVDVPYLYFMRQVTEEKDDDDDDDDDDEQQQRVGESSSSLESVLSNQLVRRIFREFVGLEAAADLGTRQAMLDFSFFLTVGNMDEAFKAIKMIKSESVWENMAQMCVKTQRLDVAAVCLGNMANAKGARALRKSMEGDCELEVRVATLAIHLGLTEEAANLYKASGRYDLLNRLYQTTNNWKQAFEIAQKHDRIHLRRTYYNYAAYLESVGAVESAIDSYEKSDTHRFEVPRMLFDDPVVLEQYVKKKKDSYLQKWWAQYLESLGEMEAAKNYYQYAGDQLSVVRICCYFNDMDQAAAVANESGDKAACYHLARQYESDGQVSAAVHFFAKAHAYSNAIRLARNHNLEDKIAQLSLMSGEGDMVEAARYYENKPGQADKAVMLYHKAGMFGRALELAFRTEQFSALDLVAADLNENTDPRILERCAEFFVQNQQYTKAVQLLAYAKKYQEAVELCTSRNVQISEKTAELLTPDKASMLNGQQRTKLLEQIADSCMQQGDYHMAAKKYTQAGSKIEAMRALLKSGDTQKIIFFANTARAKEIYIMAGNYLQMINWKDNPDLMKQIVAFYTKGGAPESLASFYEACAQVEIDDYRDYEKAQSALVEALRCLAKAAETAHKNAFQIQERQDELNKKISHIKKFLTIRTVYEADAVEAMEQLLALSQEAEIGESVRLGDIYAVLIIHSVKKANYKKAYTFLDELRRRQPRLDVTQHVKPQVLQTLYSELNMQMPNFLLAGAGSGNNGEEEKGDETTNIVPDSVKLRGAAEEDNTNSIISTDRNLSFLS